MTDAVPPAVGNLDNGPGHKVDDRLENHDTTHPAVKQVVRVEAYLEHADQGVVAAGEDDERNHAHQGKRPGAASKFGTEFEPVLVTPVKDKHVGQVAAQVAGEEEGVEARGECAHVDGF